jgi:hypothetical protein
MNLLITRTARHDLLNLRHPNVCVQDQKNQRRCVRGGWDVQGRKYVVTVEVFAGYVVAAQRR